MPDVRPFRGFRYDLGRAGALADLIAPPYDVIDDALRAELLAKSPYNAVRVELPQDDGAIDRYTAAARVFNGWLGDDALRQDSARAFYVLEQEFTVDGVTHTRCGFLARVRVEPLGTGSVFAHERTFAGPKADRLKLYHATGYNVSPVFGLYDDDEGGVMDKLKKSIGQSPPLVAVDHLGVVNRLWTVTDQHVTSAVTGMIGRCAITIADGHHRYETAVKFASEVAHPDPDHPSNYCLMHLVSVSDPGLIVRPTHRAFAAFPMLTQAEVLARLDPVFELQAEFGADAAACWDEVQLADSQMTFGLLTADGRACVVELADAAALAAAAPDQSPEWRSLAVSVLHAVLLPRLTDQEPTTRYHHDWRRVHDEVRENQCQLGVLLLAPPKADITRIAGRGEVMPQKSTYFYPKVPTGLVYNSLKKD